MEQHGAVITGYYLLFGSHLHLLKLVFSTFNKDNHHVQLPHRTQVSRPSHGYRILYPLNCLRPHTHYDWLFPTAKPAPDTSPPQDWRKQ